ncbi:hypothetical protein [Nonomuraea sp. NPDC049480]|uniref:hypothetical protein n=1 Tax=Nonomuraea sp. NPDC049480 TaxID=3364353 RepID=UPI0037AD8465
MELLNTSGSMYLTHTKIGGRVVLRMAIGGPATGRRHVEQAWEQIRWEHAALSATFPT